MKISRTAMAYLEDIEKRINPEEETAIYEAWKSFALGQIPEGVPFQTPKRTIVKTDLDWKHININDAIIPFCKASDFHSGSVGNFPVQTP